MNTENITFTTLLEFINKYPSCINIIMNQYILLLTQLTSTNIISREVFLNNINKIHNVGTIIIAYIGNPTMDIENNLFKIIASGTIIIEPKIIHNGLNCGHIEDIVVHNNYRGKGLCGQILNMLNTIAQKQKCYKVILDCDEHLLNVYKKCGFNTQNNIQMSMYFDEKNIK